MTGGPRRFLPGDGTVRPEVLVAARDGAGLEPVHGAEALAAAQPLLRRVFRTEQPVVVLPASAGLLREISLRAAVEQRAMVLVAGPESATVADTLEALGREVIRVMVHPGQTLEAGQLSRFLAGPPVDAVVVVHAETGTGALAPLAELAPVVRAADAFFLVDAAGSLGATPLEMDAWGLDLVLAPSHGALGLPPGLAFAAASPRIVARARAQRERGLELDFRAHHAAAQEGATLTPVAPALARALALQLHFVAETEGLMARWERHAALRQEVERWVGQREDLALLAPPGRRADTVSCLVLPESRSPHALTAALAGEGWQLGSGAAPDVLRLGHMGDVTTEELREVLEALGRVLGSEK